MPYRLRQEIWQQVKKGIQYVRDIDSALTELKKVTDETENSYNQFLTNAASRAKELGTTIDGLVNSTAEFAKLGYGFEEFMNFYMHSIFFIFFYFN